MRPSSKALLIALPLAAACLAGFGLSHPSRRPHAEAVDTAFRLDLNAATPSEFQLLPGLGDVTAHKIVAHRNRRGPFRSVDELTNVRGVGPKTLARLRPWVMVGADVRR